jgi:GNAT superfamily N-acetyltransferase
VTSPNATVELRPARSDEVALVRRLADTIWRAHYPGIISVAQIDYMLERFYTAEALAVFMGRDDRGLLLGLVDGEPSAFAAWYMTRNAAEAKLDKLYVLPSRQRHGLGGRLIHDVAERARNASANALILNVNKHNAQAIRAYERYGFAIAHAEVNDIGSGFVMDDYVMRKAL